MSYNQKALETALCAFAKGEMVIVIDDDGREAEGDIVVAASHCSTEKMAFLLKHTSGIICTPMPQEQADRLSLAPMVYKNDSMHTTAFTVSVDYKHGTTTGISAYDRALTVRKLAEPSVLPEEFSRPGHIFPLIARHGGVLVRAGHTEAAVDLCVLTKLFPVAVIGELTNEDGTVKKGQEIANFSQEHHLPLIKIEDLIAYRQKQEALVKRIEEKTIETSLGPALAYVYEEKLFTSCQEMVPLQHIALIFGAIEKAKEVAFCIIHENVLEDVFAREKKLQTKMAALKQRYPAVILLYIRGQSIGFSSANEQHKEALERKKRWKEIGLPAQILRDLQASSLVYAVDCEQKNAQLEDLFALL